MEHIEAAQLLLRAGAGDEQAWNRIVDDYSPLVWKVVRGFRLGEAHTADAVQTTWLRLVEHLGAIREPERLAGWLRVTAQRVCLEQLRESGREELVDPTLESRHGAPGYREPEETGPEACLLREDREALVRQALARLPERHQELLRLLVASPRLSYEEIGELMDMPVGSIGPTRARVLARLRAALAAADFRDLALG